MTDEALRRVDELLTELVELVETARTVPMSSSIVVPRERVLDLLDDLREVLPPEIHEARKLIAVREEILHEAHTDATAARDAATAAADVILADARSQGDRLVARGRSPGLRDRRGRQGGARSARVRDRCAPGRDRGCARRNSAARPSSTWPTSARRPIATTQEHTRRGEAVLVGRPGRCRCLCRQAHCGQRVPTPIARWPSSPPRCSARRQRPTKAAAPSLPAGHR